MLASRRGLQQVAGIYQNVGWPAEVTGKAFTALQCTRCRTTALEPLSIQHPHGRRTQRRRAERRDTLAACSDRARIAHDHGTSERQARYVKDAIAKRLAECGLELHPGKSRIVYCKDSNRSGSYECERFDFLGYTFRPRLSISKTGQRFVSFAPAVSPTARKAMGRVIRAWRINRRSDRTLEEFAAIINTVVRGWLNYYGRFYRSELKPVLRRINTYLIRWAMNKYKRLRGRPHRARQWLVTVHRRQPNLFDTGEPACVPTAGRREPYNGRLLRVHSTRAGG